MFVRSRRVRVLGILFASLLMLAAPPVSAQSRARRTTVNRSRPQAQAQLGINLAGPVDWNTEQFLVDVFRLSRRWISQRDGASWGKGPELQLDEHGWVTKLEPNCRADAMICTIRGGHFPGGRYTVLYEGEGKVSAHLGARVVKEAPGRLEIDVDSGKGGFALRLLEVNPRNYVRNIHVIMPGHEQTWQAEPWRPDFLQRWQGFACLRFMDFMHTNNSSVKTWDERPKVDDATWTPHGLPVEMLCDLANRLDADPWFCMPHQADDDYIRNFAKQAKELLDPKRKIYVEYSNEVWNGIFSQNRYAGEKGQELGFADKPWEAAWKYTGYRSKQIFAIWEQVFGGTDRLVRVLATQSANPYVTKQVIGFQDAWKSADAVGIAPYFGWNVKRDQADEVVRGGLDGVLKHLKEVSLPKEFKAMQQQKEIADAAGLQLVCYEAGQHLVGVGGGENNKELTELFQQANRHPSMGELYKQYLDGWAKGDGGLCCIFSSVGAWSKHGSWGLMEYTDDDPRQFPKYMAVFEWAKTHGQAVNVPR